MDILDVILAKGLTPQGQIDTYASKARKAVADADKVLSTSEQAMENIDLITEQTNLNNQTSINSLNNANETLNKANEAMHAVAVVDESILGNLNDEIDKIEISIPKTETTDYVQSDLEVNYPSGKKARLRNINKIYNKIGKNTDGSMTQKAITEELDKIKRGSGESVNLGPENDGKIVVIDANGNVKASEVTEENIVESLISGGFYDAKEAVGLEIDYKNKGFARIQGALHIEQGSDFDKYIMYGGRRRCIVNNSGKIVAWYGDSNYVEDGSLG